MVEREVGRKGVVVVRHAKVARAFSFDATSFLPREFRPRTTQLLSRRRHAPALGARGGAPPGARAPPVPSVEGSRASPPAHFRRGRRRAKNRA